MKKIVTLLMLMLCYTYTASGENIIIGDKIPDLQLRAWLMDAEPDDAPFTCILFYHSESELCRQNLRHIKQLINAHPELLNLIILTKEEYSKAGVALTEQLSDNTGVAFDDRGRTFRSFGVKFIPFCVISDHKHRAVWCGNGNTLNGKIIEKILTTKSK